MDNKLKKGPQLCVPGADCVKCPYFSGFDSGCYEALHSDALKKITFQENTIKVLMELRQKLAQELQNSLDLSKGGTG